MGEGGARQARGVVHEIDEELIGLRTRKTVCFFLDIFSNFARRVLERSFNFFFVSSLKTLFWNEVKTSGTKHKAFENCQEKRK